MMRAHSRATTNDWSSRIFIFIAVAWVLLTAASLSLAATERAFDLGVEADLGPQAIRLTQAKTSFNLPSQPLEDSLRSVAAATNSNILFDRSLVRGLTAKPLQAELSTQEAITELLRGTPLTFRNADDKTYLIAAKGRESVGITQPAEDQSTALEQVPMTAQKRVERLQSFDPR